MKKATATGATSATATTTPAPVKRTRKVAAKTAPVEAPAETKVVVAAAPAPAAAPATAKKVEFRPRRQTIQLTDVELRFQQDKRDARAQIAFLKTGRQKSDGKHEFVLVRLDKNGKAINGKTYSCTVTVIEYNETPVRRVYFATPVTEVTEKPANNNGKSSNNARKSNKPIADRKNPLRNLSIDFESAIAANVRKAKRTVEVGPGLVDETYKVNDRVAIDLLLVHGVVLPAGLPVNSVDDLELVQKLKYGYQSIVEADEVAKQFRRLLADCRNLSSAGAEFAASVLAMIPEPERFQMGSKKAAKFKK